eukprot:CAMPEP_0113286012 /NCGR_PEP_ID=MMETSP0008_2-20120614/30904_1 /TAXON_ID=97485 /ORGANISM="Prymnesium parvum" /LENGTH=38 /DNA_ID=CAMNT_0000137061 /DNA_START=85 /DNA_END=198 /DNA_ORIENTATION=+ /assembly_acc=CAM_ASM_000153
MLRMRGSTQGQAAVTGRKVGRRSGRHTAAVAALDRCNA